MSSRLDSIYCSQVDEIDCVRTISGKRLAFNALFLQREGASTTKSDLLQLPRFGPWVRVMLKFYQRMLLNYQNENGKVVN
jgi:hypothetical protein